jgi:hypothetical protein
LFLPNNPNADVPKATEEWFTASILIDNVIGDDAIDIASIFIHTSTVLQNADKQQLKALLYRKNLEFLKKVRIQMIVPLHFLRVPDISTKTMLLSLEHSVIMQLMTKNPWLN